MSICLVSENDTFVVTYGAQQFNLHSANILTKHLQCVNATLYNIMFHFSAIPEDLHRIETLEHFDMRLNQLKHSLPDVMEELPSLTRFNVSGNGLTELNTDHVKHLLQLNCNDNSLKSLSVVDGPLRLLTARNNSE